jgi:2-polyprenyl-6-methoxyphenol hydroxylase-like FAD-dependent oxidoreductase
MRVLIVGAGVAGLSCAVALRRTGPVELTIVERASEVGAQGGTGMAIPPNGARALAGIGLAVDRLVARGSRLREYRLLDTAGRELSRADLTRLWLTPRQPYFAVHRRCIYEALLEALGDQRIEYRSTVELGRAAPGGGRPIPARIVGPQGSREEAFDLVVGADGVRSELRRALWPALSPRQLGWWTWRCVVQHEGVAPEVQVVHSGLGGVFLYLPVGGGQVYVYAARRLIGGAPPREGHGRELAARFGGVGAPTGLVDAVAALPDRAFHVGPLEEVPHEWLTAAGRGCIVLVGDALHACSPNMAQGVSLAAEDGAVLAELVRTNPEVDLAHRFWRSRLPRIRHVQRHTRKRDRLAARRAESALFQRISNVVIRWRGADRMQRDAFSFLLDNPP